MFDAKHTPEQVAELSEAEEQMPATVEGYRAEIVRLNRRIARKNNLIRLASTLSSEKSVHVTLAEAQEV